MDCSGPSFLVSLRDSKIVPFWFPRSPEIYYTIIYKYKKNQICSIRDSNLKKRVIYLKLRVICLKVWDKNPKLLSFINVN